MRGKILSITLAMIMALSFTSCGEGVKEEVGLPSAQEIIDGVLESQNNIETFKFDMDMTMDMSGETGDEAFEMNIVMDSVAAVDVQNRQMSMDMTMNMVVPGEDEMEMGMDMYLVDDIMYISMESAEMDSVWMKSKMPEGSWEQMNQTESQIELLKTAQVEFKGIEKVQGVDCYVFQIIPDVEQLWQLATQQAAIGGGEVMPEVSEDFFQEMFRSFSVKQWIAKDTYYLTRAEMDMSIGLNPEALGQVEENGELSMNISMDLVAYEYNEPVAIALPPEAEWAIEMPME